MYTCCVSIPTYTTSVQICESYTAMVHYVLKRLFTRFNRSNKFRVGLTGQHVTLFFNNRLGSARAIGNNKFARFHRVHTSVYGNGMCVSVIPIFRGFSLIGVCASSRKITYDNSDC